MLYAVFSYALRSRQVIFFSQAAEVTSFVSVRAADQYYNQAMDVDEDSRLAWQSDSGFTPLHG